MLELWVTFWSIVWFIMKFMFLFAVIFIIISSIAIKIKEWKNRKFTTPSFDEIIDVDYEIISTIKVGENGKVDLFI